MLYLSDVRDYLKTLNIAQHYYVGKLDNKQECSIGVYQNTVNMNAVAIGGMINKKYGVKSVSILIHWNKNYKETEVKSLNIYNSLQTLRNVTMNNKHVFYCMPTTDEPVDVGTDDSGVYERVIRLDIYYKKED